MKDEPEQKEKPTTAEQEEKMEDEMATATSSQIPSDKDQTSVEKKEKNKKRRGGAKGYQTGSNVWRPCPNMRRKCGMTGICAQKIHVGEQRANKRSGT